jgi:hypothetical protein
VTTVASGDVWAVGGVGSFLNPQPSSPLALHWTGSVWSQVSVGSPATGELLGVAASGLGDDVAAVGDTVKAASSNPYVGTLAEALCPA